MDNSKIVRTSLVQAVIVAAYILAIALFLKNASKIFGPQDSDLSGVAFLLTFVLSAAIMGITIFGQPVMWFLEGNKKEAVRLVFYTLAWLVLLTVFVFLLLLV